MLDPSWMSQFEIFLHVLLYFLLSLYILLEQSFRAPVSLILNIKELERQVCLKIEQSSMIEHHVKFVGVILPESSQ